MCRNKSPRLKFNCSGRKCPLPKIKSFLIDRNKNRGDGFFIKAKRIQLNFRGGPTTNKIRIYDWQIQNGCYLKGQPFGPDSPTKDPSDGLLNYRSKPPKC